jgi:AcrR family transcriptional regulator
VSLRDEHRELTRRKVLAAVLDLVGEGVLDELSVPAVARRSGVSLATIYRYFPTKSDLLAAAAEEPARRAAGREGKVDRDVAVDFGELHAEMWREFSKNLPLLRHQVASEAGREMRLARLERSRAELASYLERSGIDPDTSEGQRLIALLLVVSGSLALVELYDRQQLDVETALDHSRWAVRALVDATRSETAPKRRTVEPRTRSRAAR